MRISVRAWGGALLVAVLTGGLVGGSADAVGGGATVADGEFPFVAKVSFADQRACTGALVATRWIITAKSCFADGSAPVAAGAPARPTTVLLGRPDLTRTAGHRLSVVSVTPHPDRNIALAQLSGPVKDINPISLSSEAPQAGETLRIAGFGRTASEWVPNRLHAGTFTVESTTATSIAVQGAALCKGDAGSPAFRVVGGRAELVGTSDTSWQSGCLGETETRSGAVEARTDDLVGWIRAGTALKPDRLRDPVIGEFNGDSFPDLLAPDEAGRLWLYPGTANPELWGDRVQVGSGWTGYRELVVGKMNRDQYDDLAAIEQATGKLWLYPGNAAGAPFATKTEIGAGWGTFRDLTIGRVNRDQYDDLLAVNDTNSQLILYTGTAAGTRFNEGVTYGRGWNCCTQITVGRFTNDDYDDLVTVNAAGQLLLYAGNAAAQSFDAGVVITGAGTGWSAYSYLAAGRFDGSGLDGLLAVDRATGQPWVHPRTEAGSWAARVQPPGTVWAPQPYELSNLVSGRFNGDEYADLLGTDSAGILWLHPGTSADTYGPRVQFGAGWIGYRELVVGKMNRDQYDDLAAIEQATGKLWLYPGNATGTPATTKTEIGAGWGTFRDLTIGRVNRDQYDDLLAVNDTNSQLILYTGTAAGTRFNEGVTYGRGWNCCTQITVGRFTNDDYDDLVTVNAAGQLLLYAGNAAAQSFDAGVVITDAGTGWANRSDLTRFRVTGDTHDSLLSKDRSGSLLVHRNTGGTFDWSDPVRSGPRD